MCPCSKQEREPDGRDAVNRLMNVLSLILVVAMCSLTGCTSVSTPAQRTVTPWPPSVATRCPPRKILPECFRRQAIHRSMKRLVSKLNACNTPGWSPILVMFTIETQGGKPTCVEHGLGDNEIAQCLATTVARHLVIPSSPKNEWCHFRYPIRFASSADSVTP